MPGERAGKGLGQIEYGIIEPQANLDSLVQVFIIKDFDVVE